MPPVKRAATKKALDDELVQAEAASLKKLWDEKRGTSQADFGDTYGIGTQGMVWQYLRGRRPLNLVAAVSFAQGLGVPLRSFSPRLADEFEQMQRKLGEIDQQVESKMSKTEAMQILDSLSEEDREAWLKHGRLLVQSHSPKGPNNPYGPDH